MFRRKGKEFWQSVFKKSQLIRMSILVVSLLIIPSVNSTAFSQERVQDDSWQFGIGIYGWAAGIGGDTTSGEDISSDSDASVDDILDTINFVFMGEFEARKSKWLFMTDIVYLDLGNDKNRTLSTAGGSIDVNTDIQIKSRVVAPAIGYYVVDTDKVQFNAFAGARYLNLEVNIEENINAPSRPLYAEVSGSSDIWDGIVGFKAHYAFNENWHMPLYFDLGTGDSEFTWQAAAGIAYRFEICSVSLMYRYLSWDFDDSIVLDDLTISGPMLGVKFVF